MVKNTGVFREYGKKHRVQNTGSENHLKKSLITSMTGTWLSIFLTGDIFGRLTKTKKNLFPKMFPNLDFFMGHLIQSHVHTSRLDLPLTPPLPNLPHATPTYSAAANIQKQLGAAGVSYYLRNSPFNVHLWVEVCCQQRQLFICVDTVPRKPNTNTNNNVISKKNSLCAA